MGPAPSKPVFFPFAGDQVAGFGVHGELSGPGADLAFGGELGRGVESDLAAPAVGQAAVVEEPRHVLYRLARIASELRSTMPEDVHTARRKTYDVTISMTSSIS